MSLCWGSGSSFLRKQESSAFAAVFDVQRQSRMVDAKGTGFQRSLE